jgi:hypothetical protein
LDGSLINGVVELDGVELLLIRRGR